MPSEAPPFWWEKPDWRAALLWPLSAAYGAVASRRFVSARREPVGLPVLCVGNLTVGGAGKTPVAIMLARAARSMGLSPGFVTRGHGGSLSAPHLVDPHHDIARSTGDEPLLLAEHAPTAVTPDRAAGARLVAAEGCDFIIMDDGFQSARIAIDFALLVIDARRGLGNGFIIPAGPMRAPLVQQMRHADAVVRIGEGSAADHVVRMASRAGRRVFDAATRPVDAEAFAGRRFVAFAGIGHPQKFFDTVEAVGGTLAATRTFPDHRLYDDDDLADLAELADKEGAELITTSKDAVRLRHGSPAARAMLERLNVLHIETVFEPEGAERSIIEHTLHAFERKASA